MWKEKNYGDSTNETKLSAESDQGQTSQTPRKRFNMRRRLATLLVCALASGAGNTLLAQTEGSVDSTRAIAALAFVEQAAKASEPDAAGVWKRVTADRAEFENAFNWFITAGRASDAARFVTAISPFLPARDARDWFARVLDIHTLDSSPQVRMPLLITGSYIAFHVGDQERARRWAQDLLETARSAGDRARASTGYFRLSQVELRNRNLPAFHRINEAMLAFCREAQDERCEVNVRNMRGEAARVEQNYALATEMNETNLTYGRENNRPVTVLTATVNLVFIDIARGVTAEVKDRLLTGITGVRARNDRETLAVLVAAMGMLAERENHPESAARLLGVAAAELERLGRLPDPADQLQIAQCTARVRMRLGKSAFARAFATGRRQTLDDALAEVVGH